MPNGFVFLNILEIAHYIETLSIFSTATGTFKARNSTWPEQGLKKGKAIQARTNKQTKQGSVYNHYAKKHNLKEKFLPSLFLLNYMIPALIF